MRVVIQRVKEATVTVDNAIIGKIGIGLLVLLGVSKEDLPDQTQWLANKLVDLRIFSDHNGKMNLSVKDVGGEILVVSQFTLYGNCTNGRRPDFVAAAGPDIAEPAYNHFVRDIKRELGRVQTGQFGAKMEVSLVNDGPVTFILEN